MLCLFPSQSGLIDCFFFFAVQSHVYEFAPAAAACSRPTCSAASYTLHSPQHTGSRPGRDTGELFPVPVFIERVLCLTVALLWFVQVHCSLMPIPDPDFKFDLELGDSTVTVRICISSCQFFLIFVMGVFQLYLRTRPHLEEFLRRMSRTYDVCVFTASAKIYASRVLRMLDPKAQYIKHVVLFAVL